MAPNGQIIGEGNLLAALIVPQKHNHLLWGAGGFLLGSMDARPYEKAYDGTTLNSEEEKPPYIRILFCLSLPVVGILILTLKGLDLQDPLSTFPAKQIAAFYNYSLFLPVSEASRLLCVYILPLTNYPNLNLVLAIAATVITLVVAALIVILFFRRFPWFAWSLLLLYLYGPWVFWGGWLIYKWLSVKAGGVAVRTT